MPLLIEMGAAFHEAKQDKYPFDEASTRAFFDRIMAHGVILITDDGFLAGMAAAEPSNEQYKVAHELFWWSEGRSGLRLRRAFEKWATDAGCDEVQFSHPHDETTVAALMERAGYEPATLVWRKKCA